MLYTKDTVSQNIGAQWIRSFVLSVCCKRKFLFLLFCFSFYISSLLFVRERFFCFRLCFSSVSRSGIRRKKNCSDPFYFDCVELSNPLPTGTNLTLLARMRFRLRLWSWMNKRSNIQHRIVCDLVKRKFEIIAKSHKSRGRPKNTWRCGLQSVLNKIGLEPKGKSLYYPRGKDYWRQRFHIKI